MERRKGKGFELWDTRYESGRKENLMNTVQDLYLSVVRLQDQGNAVGSDY